MKIGSIIGGALATAVTIKVLGNVHKRTMKIGKKKKRKKKK